MGIYRKKPIEINAVQFRFGVEHPALKKIIGYKGYNDQTGQDEFEESFIIETLEGPLTVNYGSWIVGPGVKGEYWPVDEEVFAKTYEKVRD